MRAHRQLGSSDELWKLEVQPENEVFDGSDNPCDANVNGQAKTHHLRFLKKFEAFVL